MAALRDDATYGSQNVIRHGSDGARVARLGRRLVEGLPPKERESYRWSFNVVGEKSVNAVAFPGGFIFVHEGLLKMADSDAEIAGVLAHEIGHVLSRHSQREIIKANIIGVLIGMFLNEDGDGRQESNGEALGEVLLKYASHFGDLKFSRANEFEADTTGFHALVGARLEPRGMVRFFEKLLRMEGPSGGALEQWESTHPATRDRIGALEDQYSSLPSHILRSLGDAEGGATKSTERDTGDDGGHRWAANGAGSGGYWDSKPETADAGFTTVKVPGRIRAGDTMRITYPDGREARVRVPGLGGSRVMVCYSPSDNCFTDEAGPKTRRRRRYG